LIFLADLISLLDVNPHNEHPGIILESEFFDEADFTLRYSNIQRRVVSARIGSAGMYSGFDSFFQCESTFLKYSFFKLLGL